MKAKLTHHCIQWSPRCLSSSPPFLPESTIGIHVKNFLIICTWITRCIYPVAAPALRDPLHCFILYQSIKSCPNINWRYFFLQSTRYVLHKNPSRTKLELQELQLIAVSNKECYFWLTVMLVVGVEFTTVSPFQWSVTILVSFMSSSFSRLSSADLSHSLTSTVLSKSSTKTKRRLT